MRDRGRRGSRPALQKHPLTPKPSLAALVPEAAVDVLEAFEGVGDGALVELLPDVHEPALRGGGGGIVVWGEASPGAPSAQERELTLRGGPDP